jgi:hypothetical protein
MIRVGRPLAVFEAVMKLPFLVVSLLAALGAGSLAGGCASSPKPRAEASPTRVKDSAPDKVAAQRTANPQLGLEAEDERWGISAAQERKADQKTSRPPAGTTPSGTGQVDVTGPVPAPPPASK